VFELPDFIYVCVLKNQLTTTIERCPPFGAYGVSKRHWSRSFL